MSKIVQWKRGNTIVNSTYVGAVGEITVNTDDWSLNVHDGVTPGGNNISNYTPSGNVINVANAVSLSYTAANNTALLSTGGFAANADLKIVASDGTYGGYIFLRANSNRMSFNTVSNAFDFNLNGLVSGTGFIASQNELTGYSFYTGTNLYSGFSHINAPVSYLRITHDNVETVRFYANNYNEMEGSLSVIQTAGLGGTLPNAFISAYSNVSSYSQLATQNLSDGAAATTDFVATADLGNDISYYVDLGIAGSGYDNTSPFNSLGTSLYPLDSYLYAQGNTNEDRGGNLVVGTVLPGKVIRFIAGGVDDANVVATISESNVAVSGNITTVIQPATGNIVTDVRHWEAAGANLYVWFDAASKPDVVAIGNYGNIVGWSVSVSDGNQAIVTETNPAGYFSISTDQALTGSGNLTFTSPDYVASAPKTLTLTVGSNDWYFDNNGALTAPGTIFSGNIVGNTQGYAIGYRDVPQVVFDADATLALTDAGKHYFSTNSANVITIPNNATVSFNIGTEIRIVQQGTANLTINPDTDVVLHLTGNSVAGSRTLGNYGMATLLKVATDTWFITGTGVN